MQVFWHKSTLFSMKYLLSVLSSTKNVYAQCVRLHRIDVWMRPIDSGFLLLDGVGNTAPTCNGPRGGMYQLKFGQISLALNSEWITFIVMARQRCLSPAWANLEYNVSNDIGQLGVLNGKDEQSLNDESIGMEEEFNNQPPWCLEQQMCFGASERPSSLRNWQGSLKTKWQWSPCKNDGYDWVGYLEWWSVIQGESMRRYPQKNKNGLPRSGNLEMMTVPRFGVRERMLTLNCGIELISVCPGLPSPKRWSLLHGRGHKERWWWCP